MQISNVIDTTGCTGKAGSGNNHRNTINHRIAIKIQAMQRLVYLCSNLLLMTLDLYSHSGESSEQDSTSGIIIGQISNGNCSACHSDCAQEGCRRGIITWYRITPNAIALAS